MRPPIDQELWRIIATGGLWTPAELREQRPLLTVRQINDALQRMARAGMLHKGGQHGHRAYSVRRETVIPSGMTVGEVLTLVA